MCNVLPISAQIWYNMAVNNSIDQRTSEKLRAGSLIAALLVVAIHVPFEFAEGSCAWYFRSFLSDGIARIAVPYFFVVSGAMVAIKSSEDGWWQRAVIKRIRTLTVPLIAWSFLYALIVLVCVAVGNIKAGRSIFTLPYFINSGWVLKMCCIDPFNNVPISPLWYLRALFIFIILSPLFLIGLFVLYGIVCPTWESVDDSWMVVFRHCLSLQGLFYFSLGLYLIKSPPPKAKPWRLCASTMLFLILIMISTICKAYSWSIGQYIQVCAIPLGLYSFWMFLPPGRRIPAAIDKPFSIYVIHGFVFAILNLLATVAHIKPIKAHNIAEYVALYISIVITSILLSMVIKRMYLQKIFLGARDC